MTDFWLPEFEPSPDISDESIQYPFPTQKKRGRWVKKTMSVKQDKEDKYHLHMHLIHLTTSEYIPRCHCKVCQLVNNTATLQVPKDARQVWKDLEFVAHGKEKFTLYERNKPWQRMHINNCTNPHPLERRIPPLITVRGETCDSVYHRKMLHPGRVIQSPKKRSKN